MPEISAARSSHVLLFWKTWNAPKPMIPRAITPTRANRAIGPQLRPWLTLIGVIGLRGPPLFFPGVFLAEVPERAGPALRAGAPAFFCAAPAAAESFGLPPGFVLADRLVLPPRCGVLMLMRPRHVVVKEFADPGVAASRIVTSTSGRRQV